MDADVVVIGGGPTGAAAAIGLARAGLATVHLAPPAAGDDRRTAALLAGSVAFLERLGVWEALGDAPRGRLRAMRLVDATGRLIRAPEVTFDAGEIGLATFGWNLRNRDLTAAMARVAATTPGLTTVPRPAAGVRTAADCVTVEVAPDAEGASLEIVAPVAVAADGRASPTRAAAGIEIRAWSYRQTALVGEIVHSAPHGDTSTEFHTRAGPLTLVPLAADRSSFVWVERPEAAATLLALPPDALAHALEERSLHLLGSLRLDGPVQGFPLAGAGAARLAASRVLLVGEAAHLFPPIGAQGLNLGLRDAAAAIETIARAKARDADPGGADTLARYQAARSGDIRLRTLAVDLFGRSLLTGFFPVQAGRAVGLSLLSRFEPLRRFALREGVSPRLATPALAAVPAEKG